MLFCMGLIFLVASIFNAKHSVVYNILVIALNDAYCLGIIHKRGRGRKGRESGGGGPPKFRYLVHTPLKYNDEKIGGSRV